MAGRRLRKLDLDGVQMGYVGTGIWAGLAVAATLLGDQLAAADRLWWRDVTYAGFVLGLIGLRHVVLRRRRLLAGEEDPN